MSAAEPEQTVTQQNEAQEQDDDKVPEEEVVQGNWITPQVEVKEVETVTGEEGEEVLWKHRSKLYRWAAESQEWKERGVGDAKLLKHSENGKVRFLLRQEKTLKVVANHYVVRKDPYCDLIPNAGNEKIWVWTVPDFADGELKVEQFALKFAQVEQAKVFKEKFDEAVKLNGAVFKDLSPKRSEARKSAESTCKASTGPGSSPEKTEETA